MLNKKAGALSCIVRGSPYSPQYCGVFSRVFSAVDDVYCMFVGMLENLPQLRQTYGLSKLVNEVVLITEMYRVLRDRGPYSADQVIQDLVGAFAFVLYDNKAKKLLVACVSALCF